MTPPKTTSKTPPIGQSPQVLYVDDEEKSVKYFRALFEQEFPILTATSVAEAEALLESDGARIGVLISDQRMPLRTGAQLLGQVKKRHPQIVRLLTTAYADLEAAVEAVNEGEIYRYVLKPWDIENLRQELRGALELYRRKHQEKELLEARRSTMLSMAAQIAHELRTPLASVRAAMHGLREFLPELAEAYRSNTPPAYTPHRIPSAHLETLQKVPDDVSRVVDRANHLINMVLMNARGDLEEQKGYSNFSVRECIEDALRFYPFLEGERELVQLSGADFLARGSDVLYCYVIYNLLKNALDAHKSAGKGTIEITLQPADGQGRVCFRDTCSGISPVHLSRIFDEFYSGKGPGTGNGMGLSFCKRVLTGFGGSIDCCSEQGVYTEFDMILPGPTHGDDAR